MSNETINVYNEIGKLRKIFLHRPSSEIENISPDLMNSFLLDDIPYLKGAQEEHDIFAQIFLDANIEVLYLEQLIEETLNIGPEIRAAFTADFLREAGVFDHKIVEGLSEYLASLTIKELVRKIISGIRSHELADQLLLIRSLSTLEHPFICDPIPNLYFTRDTFTAIANGLSINHMQNNVRFREALFIEYILRYHPLYVDKSIPIWYNRGNMHSIEGGDILVLNKDYLAVGISTRTSPEGIKALARKLFAHTDYKTILAFDIPKSRSCMHLDTVLTQVDYSTFVVFPDLIDYLSIFKIAPDKDDLRIEKEESSLEKVLEAVSRAPVDLIKCGNADKIIAKREQWNDASNTLAIAPGELIVYARNYVTNELLDKAGIKLHPIPSSELSRGRGGPRCMSMPFYRDDL